MSEYEGLAAQEGFGETAERRYNDGYEDGLVAGRLEGVQAERERLLAVLNDLAVWKQGSGMVPPWRIKDAIREALGGVHPETWVFVPFDPPGKGGVHPEASDG